jgi:hypothetical protein
MRLKKTFRKAPLPDQLSNSGRSAIRTRRSAITGSSSIEGSEKSCESFIELKLVDIIIVSTEVKMLCPIKSKAERLRLTRRRGQKTRSIGYVGKIPGWPTHMLFSSSVKLSRVEARASALS